MGKKLLTVISFSSFRGLLVRSFLLILFLAIGASAFSQDFKKQFNKAKDQFSKGSYSTAMDGFNALIVYDQNNPYSEYASFYYALSAQRLGFTTLAKSQLSAIRKTYPTWSQLSEVNLWLATLFFEHSDFFQAMLLLDDIKDNALFPKCDSLKRFYLAKIEDVETIKMLREDHPHDREVDRALVRAIGRNSFTSVDIGLFDSLLTKYAWNRDEFLVPDQVRSIKKDRYRVAVLFPFQVATLEPSPEKKRNQPILDLYQGMRLAADSLNKTAIGIDLIAYDTERNVETTKTLLTRPELMGADLIVGPLFAEDAKAVQLFSQKNEINLIVNPVSSNSDFIQQNPFSFLYQPSHATMGKKAAEMVATRPRKKTSMVYYGESPKDSVMAFNYIKRALDLGVKVVYAEEIRRETSAGIFEKLAKATKYDEWKNPLEFTLKKDSIGSIFVASDDPVIYTKVINSVESRGDSILVIGQESWLQDNAVEYSKFDDNGVVFVAPNYYSPGNPAFLKFRSAYISKHGLMPPDNAIKGYETMMNIGRALQLYGNYFQDGLLVGGALSGVLTSGYLLQPTRDNGLVPFVHFKEGQLEAIK
ncbi:MAG: amino acid ABC transporter substrate-binding protein [Cyclobacteriaceae bacterium]|nr:amino acid ABC transporter substrate-binding protein [Cyclobacteriaceae bacterium]